MNEKTMFRQMFLGENLTELMDKLEKLIYYATGLPWDEDPATEAWKDNKTNNTRYARAACNAIPILVEALDNQLDFRRKINHINAEKDLKIIALEEEAVKYREKIRSLSDDSEFLNCLRSCGVDNWDGYGDATRMMAEASNTEADDNKKEGE